MGVDACVSQWVCVGAVYLLRRLFNSIENASSHRLF